MIELFVLVPAAIILGLGTVTGFVIGAQLRKWKR